MMWFLAWSFWTTKMVSEVWINDWIGFIREMKQKKGYLTESSRLAVEEIDRRLKRRTPSDISLQAKLDLVFDGSFITVLNKIWETRQYSRGLEPGSYYEQSPKNMTKEELSLYKKSGELKTQVLSEYCYRKTKVYFNREFLSRFLFSMEHSELLVLGKPTDARTLCEKYGLYPEAGADPDRTIGICPTTGYKSLFQEVLLFRDGKSQGVWFIEVYFLGETAYRKIA